jgi:hypothetical protein
MLLASIVLAAQVSGPPPARAAVAKPCADPSVLCQISPFFCPGTYPAGMEPCWPEATRETRTLSNRPATAAGGAVRQESARPGTTSGSPRRAPITRPAPAKLQSLER